MPWRKTLTSGLGVMLCLLLGWGSGLAGKESALVPAETVVDYIHAVLTSDRTFYTVHVVEGMQRRGVIESSENWRILWRDSKKPSRSIQPRLNISSLSISIVPPWDPFLQIFCPIERNFSNLEFSTKFSKPLLSLKSAYSLRTLKAVTQV